MEVRVTLTGRSALVMHNGRLADPLDPIARELAALTSKHGRTEIEEEQVGAVEWRGSLYWHDELGAYIPAPNFLRCFRNAATNWKLGAALKKALIPLAEGGAVHHDGPKTIAALAARPEFTWRATVKLNGRTSVPRTRPIFRKWSTAMDFELEEEELSFDDLVRIADRAGRLEGIGDANKIGYGRFTAEVSK